MMLRHTPRRGNDAGPDGSDGEHQSDINSGDEGTSRWTKAGTACAAVFGAMLLSSVAIIAWDRMSSDAPAHADRVPPANAPAIGTVTSPRATPQPVSSALSAPVSSSAAAGPGAPTPTRVTWLQVGLGALPFSTTAGPAAIRAGVPSGFAHTEAGAVEAAVQILGRLSWSAQTRTAMQAVVAAATTPAAQAQVVLSYGPPTDASVIPQVAGFQVVTYSSAQAVVDLALRFNGALRVAPARMQWIGGDWKLAGSPGPLGQANWAAIDDLTGYILFSGQPTKAGS